MPWDGEPVTLFAVAAQAYDRLTGRYLATLGPRFAEAAGVTSGQRVLDVGCGPGGFTGELVRRTGASGVSALDPSQKFVEACRKRHPGVDVRVGFGEHLPWADATFDATLASLVVGFMSDPVAGVTEMRRTARAGGRVAVSAWALDEMPLLDTFWWAVEATVGPVAGEDDLLGRSPGELTDLLEGVGLTDVVEQELTASARYAGLDDWWSSFTGGAGPAGACLRALAPDERIRVRAACDRDLMEPRGPFTMHATALCAVGTVPG